MACFKPIWYLLLVVTTGLNAVISQNTTTVAPTTAPTTVAPNKAPVLTTANTKYKIIAKNFASDAVIHQVYAADPEQGKLIYSITGVTYYRNGTTPPVKAFDKTWAVNKLPNGTDNACKIAESYPFPRNLFCIVANQNTIKATTKFNQFSKADYSLFKVDVVVFDSGTPQKNLTTSYYFRIKESCPQASKELLAIQNQCPNYLSVLSIKAASQEVGYSFIIPNRAKISRLTITPGVYKESTFIGENINFVFSYTNGTLRQTHTVTRRFLTNFTVEPSLSIHFWNPIVIQGSTGNVSVTFEIQDPKRFPVFNYGIVNVYAVSDGTNYCGNDTCVTLYKDIEYAWRKTNQYECARDETFLLISKYSTCPVLPKPPVWRNSDQNYVFINATSQAGTPVFSFVATDVTSSSKVLFSIIGVTYYKDDTSPPSVSYSTAWARTTAQRNSITPNCKTAESYPFPRNLFCVNALENTIKTTGMFSTSHLSKSSLFVLDVFIATDGKPNMNTTGKVYVRIVQNCSIASTKSCLLNVGLIRWRGFGAIFNFTVANASLHKIKFDFGGFHPFNHIGKMVTYTLTYSKSGALIARDQRRLLINTIKEKNLLIPLKPTPVLNEQISLTVVADGVFLSPIRGYDFNPMTIYTLSSRNYCLDETCRGQYAKERSILKASNSLECLKYDTTHLYDAKYSSCKTVFSVTPSSRSISRDLTNGSAISTVKAIANDAVLYSITGVSYWQNDSSSAVIAKNSNWAVRTRSDALRSCSISEKYPFPRNLFCISPAGAIMPTSLFRYRLEQRSTVVIDVLAANMGNQKDNATRQMFLYLTPTLVECEPILRPWQNMLKQCDLTINPPIYPLQQKPNFYQFIAPANASLLTQIGVRPSILANLKTGDIFTYALARTGGKSLSISRPLIVEPANRFRFDYVNTSLYREPVMLSPLEPVVITITSSSGVVPSQLAKNILMITVPVKEHCITSCFDSFSTAVNHGGKLAPRFPCVIPDQYFFDGKYGRCFANSPPSLLVQNIITNGVTAGSTIGRLTATDKEGSVLTYGILSVTSKKLNRNYTRNVFTGQSCTQAVNEPAPFSYLCVSQTTGEIKVTAKFPQMPGEVLTVKAYVIDSGTPKRHGVKIFTVSIRNPCEKTEALYKNVTGTKCFAGSNKIASPRNTQAAPTLNIATSRLNLDNIVFLEIFPSLLQFPKNTLYTVFTLQAVTFDEPTVRRGEKYNVTLLPKFNKAKSVKIPVHIPVYGSSEVQISAVAVTNVSMVTTTKAPVITTIAATTQNAPNSTTTTTITAAPSTAAPTTANIQLTLPPINQNQTEIKPLRRRRLVESFNVIHQSIGFSTINVSLQLSKESVRIHGQTIKDFCGDISCVKAFLTWKEELQKTGLKICQVDPMQANQYFQSCSAPPKFSQHPKDIHTKLASQASVSCSYQNFTGVTFQWMKDNKVYTPRNINQKLNVDQREYSSLQVSTVSSSTASGTSQKLTTKTLLLDTRDPEMQGYYSCYVKDELNHVVTSKPSLLRFKDVSSSKMRMKIKKTFTNALNDATSAEYKSFANDVTSILHSRLNKIGLPSNRKIVLSNIRPGSVLVDASVYFLNVTNSTKKAVCSGLRNISSVQTQSSLEISSLELVPYDCCYTSQTGETQIKGIITWQPVIADAFDTKQCPYVRDGVQNSATRFCMANFNQGGQWLEPNITVCPYKTKTTQKLEEISQTKIDATNAKTISSELDSVTSSVDKITNRLDIKFTADTINNLVTSKQKLEDITNDIINTTSNIMEISTKIIASAQANYNSSSKMLTSLDLLANSVPVSANKTQSIVRKNVALAVKVVETSSGVMIKATTGNKLGYNTLSISSTAYDQSKVKDSAATIYLSQEMLQKVKALKKGSTSRIFSFVFENSRLFLSKNAIYGNATNLRKMNSRILSATVGDLVMRNLTEEEEMTGLFEPLETQGKGKVECVYWDFKFQDGFGAWSTNGCRSDGMQGNMHRCRCNHMTNFAILLDVTGKGTPPHAALALSVVTYIGCGISLVCLIITFLTFVIFKNLRKPLPPRILICLCFALIVTLIIFLASAAAKDLRSCQAVGLLIHYFVLVSFSWMAVEGFNLYLSFVKIMNTRIHLFILKSSIVAWGVPAVIVAITAGVTKLNAYGKKNGDEWLCMITGIPFYVAYLTPILLVVVVNLIVLAYVLKSLSRSSQLSKDKKMTGLTQIRIAAACSVLMGTTWIIGLFAIDVLTLPVQILFCIFNSLQGLFIFLFYCVRNADVRKQWKRVFGIRERDTSKTSSGQEFIKKGYSSDKPAAMNKGFSNQSRKPHLLKPADQLPMESFGKSTTLTSVHSTLIDDRTTFSRDSRIVEDSPKLAEKSEESPEIPPATDSKPRMYGEDTAEMSFGFETVELSIKPILNENDESTRM